MQEGNIPFTLSFTGHLDMAKLFKARACIDGAESVLLYNSNSSCIFLHEAFSAPSIHARALKDFTTSSIY